MISTSNFTNDALINQIKASAEAYSKLIGYDFLIIGKNRTSPYLWFEYQFDPENFMHLLGIKSRTLAPKKFYDYCLPNAAKMIALSDCNPSRNHSRKTINEKCSCAPNIFDISAAGYMKLGHKDLMSQYVDFQYAYGNTATLGFSLFGNICHPVTLIPRSINEYSSKPYRVLFICRRHIGQDKYNETVSEVKKGLFDELYHEFPDELKAKLRY